MPLRHHVSRRLDRRDGGRVEALGGMLAQRQAFNVRELRWDVVFLARLSRDRLTPSDHARSAQPVNVSTTPAKLTKDGVGVLSQLWYSIHSQHAGICHSRWQ
jgi:hypothetical protein